MKKKILCGILCFNNEKVINKLIKDIKLIEKKVDLIFINDHSTDKTLEILKNRKKKIISHKKNLGYGAAVKSAYTHAIKKKYEVLTIFPGDYQRSINDLLKLIDHQKKKNYDLVSGSKFLAQNKLFISRKFGNIFFSSFAKFFWNSKFEDNLSGFKVYKVSRFKKIIKRLPDDYSFDICLNQIIFRNNFYCSELRVNCKYNAQTSKMKNIFNFSRKNILFIGLKMILNSLNIHFKINTFRAS
ncbi:glycosyltransferase family 2 protein [Candidatus Pelagibacter bacterium]|nr:glycosyltransferase family 2 protein [Candidatus Pelagibacter bacterium]MDB2710019.1 glycosyltransferase family 2 protein [Candidatus Pelagibacter bacterium]